MNATLYVESQDVPREKVAGTPRRCGYERPLGHGLLRSIGDTVFAHNVVRCNGLLKNYILVIRIIIPYVHERRIY